MSLLLPFAGLLAFGPPNQANPQTPKPMPVGMSVSFAFEPRVDDSTQLDSRIEAYDFAPLGSPLFITYGLRGRVWTRKGWVAGAAMTYGFARRDDPISAVPTTLTRFESTFTGGHQLGAGFLATVDAGFAAQTVTVGSERQGGALVYLGPVIQPRIGYTIVSRGAFVHLTVGYSAHVPVGDAHDNVLWEEPFAVPAIHAFLFGIESGFGAGIVRWRWK